MGACAQKECHDKKNEIKVNLKGNSQLDAIIQSYTQGLKTQIRNSMNERDIFGQVKKIILAPGKDVNSTNHPILTIVYAKGAKDDIEEFKNMLKEIVDESTVMDIKTVAIADLGPPELLRATIEQTPEKIMSRKGSDAGDEPGKDKSELSNAAKNQAKLREKMKKFANTLSNIPFLAEYAEQISEKWSIKIEEQPKEVFSATALFHPYGTYSFQLYREDGPTVLKACLEWKTQIPINSIELFSISGIPLIDLDTMQKEKNFIFIDNRVTRAFFSNHAEEELKKKIEDIINEPFVFHKMALHKMTYDCIKNEIIPKEEEISISVLKDDLGISGIMALKILKLFKSS